MVRQVGAGLVAATPLEFMLGLMANSDLPLTMRLDAAALAAPYVHPRLQAVAYAQQPSGSSELGELLAELDGMSRGIPDFDDGGLVEPPCRRHGFVKRPR